MLKPIARSFFSLPNLGNIALVLAGSTAVILLVAKRKPSQDFFNGITVALLCVLALSELVQRTTTLTAIESAIAGIATRQHDCVFERNPAYTWSQAIKMVDELNSGGFLYDTVSITSNNRYEKAVQDAIDRGVKATRLICRDDPNIRVSELVRTSTPENHANNAYLEYVLEHSLSADMLITQYEGYIQAIIAFRTAKIPKDYSSAVRIDNTEFAYELLAMFNNVLLSDGKLFTVKEKV
ncbi:MAG TPA: hypothetical protein VMZ31_13275 [Phycisphaerae bacterium]|nr:hypothetical protein [Phycisphaerae bacterium]